MEIKMEIGMEIVNKMDAATMTHGLMEWVRRQWVAVVYTVLDLYQIYKCFVTWIGVMPLESPVVEVHMRVCLLCDASAVSDCMPVCPRICAGGDLSVVKASLII